MSVHNYADLCQSLQYLHTESIYVDECSNLKLGLKPDYIAEHAPSKSDLRD